MKETIGQGAKGVRAELTAACISPLAQRAPMLADGPLSERANKAPACVSYDVPLDNEDRGSLTSRRSPPISAGFN